MTEPTISMMPIPVTSTWWHRLVDRLFPTIGLPVPTPEEMLGWAPNYATITTGAKLNWRERIRLLIGGRLKLVLQLRTDAPVARMATKIVCYPLPPAWALADLKPIPLSPEMLKQVMDGRETRRRGEIASPSGLRQLFPGLKAKK